MIEFYSQDGKEILDFQEITDLQNKFKEKLEPIFQMLKAKREKLPYSEWIDLVNKTHESILSSPEQFIDGTLSGKQTFKVVIENVFKSFLEQFRHRWDL